MWRGHGKRQRLTTRRTTPPVPLGRRGRLRAGAEPPLPRLRLSVFPWKTSVTGELSRAPPAGYCRRTAAASTRTEFPQLLLQLDRAPAKRQTLICPPRSEGVQNVETTTGVGLPLPCRARLCPVCRTCDSFARRGTEPARGSGYPFSAARQHFRHVRYGPRGCLGRRQRPTGRCRVVRLHALVGNQRQPSLAAYATGVVVRRFGHPVHE